MESEFRKDLVSGDWVLIAAGRAARPHPPKPRAQNYQAPGECPFESAADAPAVRIIANDFPAVTPGVCGPVLEHNGYQVTAGVGRHEIFIMKDHDKQLYDFSPEEMASVVRAYRSRYEEISKSDDCGQYIMIFNNYGREGGASVFHPHSQMITLPIIPPDVARSLRGSYEYFKHHGVEAHALMIEKEQAAKERILFENEQFIAFCPYVSKHPYEMRIYPKFASSHFEHLEEQSVIPLSEALTTVLKKMHDKLADPAYNFFIHTAPIHYEKTDFSSDQYYRWHIEVLPRVSFDAGFEAGTGIKINIIDPDAAAKTLNS